MLVTIAAVVAAAVAGGVLWLTPAEASSHREAPNISTDPQADTTDVYAFVSPNNPDTVTLIANYIPFEQPAGGPTFYRFGKDVRYEFNIDNNGDAKDDITFRFNFNTKYENPDSPIYNTGPITSLDDPDLNRKSFYSVSMVRGNNQQGQVIADGLQEAPTNVGPASYPQGYRPVAQQAIYSLDNGMKVFAGPRDDPFFLDLGGGFDLLQFRKLQGLAPVDDFAGLNVHSLAIQVPKSMLRGPNDSVIGVRSTSYRQKTTVLRDLEPNGPPFPEARASSGPFVQLSRLDIPLVNELIIADKDSDRWNNSKPVNDAQFLEYVQDPLLATLIGKLFGLDVPPAPRDDLVTIFLTGIPDLNQPANVTPSSQLRLNMDVPPAANPNRLGVLGGDNAGFPNGRRLIDDVVDIELTALAGGTPFTPQFNDQAHKLGDGVNSNDVPFLDTFPYVNAPHDYAGSTYPGLPDSSGTGGPPPENGGPPPTNTGSVGDIPAMRQMENQSNTTSSNESDDTGALERVWQKVTGILPG